MIDKFQSYSMNFYIIARYAVPIMLFFSTVALGLRYLFGLNDASEITMLVAFSLLAFLLVLPLVAAWLFPKIRLPGKPVSDTEWIIYLLWIVILISIKIWIKASSY
jgi:hypothetical protein